MFGGNFRILDNASTGNVDYRAPGVTRFYYSVAWGVVTRPPTERINKRTGKTCLYFSIMWKRNQYINFYVPQKNPFAYEIAKQLYPGDPVFVCCHASEREYTPRRGLNAGKERTDRRGRVQFLLPLRMVAGIMAAMHDASEAPDILEGLEEYLRETQEELREKEADSEIPF